MMLVAPVVLLTLVVHAHDGVNDAWFRDLKIPSTQASCCNSRDCLPTEAELRGPHWWARTPDGTWHEIPPEKVIHDKGNPVGQPILCSYPFPKGDYLPICFVPGALF